MTLVIIARRDRPVRGLRHGPVCRPRRMADRQGSAASRWRVSWRSWRGACRHLQRLLGRRRGAAVACRHAGRADRLPRPRRACSSATVPSAASPTGSRPGPAAARGPIPVRDLAFVVLLVIAAIVLQCIRLRAPDLRRRQQPGRRAVLRRPRRAVQVVDLHHQRHRRGLRRRASRGAPRSRPRQHRRGLRAGHHHHGAARRGEHLRRLGRASSGCSCRSC